jgi:hypothetical protein
MDMQKFVGVRNGLAVVLVAAMLLIPRIIRAQDTLYNSQNPKLPVTMTYPLSWKLVQTEGSQSKYASFELVGPMNPARSFAAHIGIMAQDPSEGASANALEYLDKTIENMKGTSSRWELLGRGAISYWAENVPYIDVAYMLPLPLGSVKFVWTEIKERRYAIMHSGALWTFSYAAAADGYDANVTVFQHLMDTFFFNK